MNDFVGFLSRQMVEQRWNCILSLRFLRAALVISTLGVIQQYCKTGRYNLS